MALIAATGYPAYTVTTVANWASWVHLVPALAVRLTQATLQDQVQQMHLVQVGVTLLGSGLAN